MTSILKHFMLYFITNFEPTRLNDSCSDLIFYLTAERDPTDNQLYGKWLDNGEFIILN